MFLKTATSSESIYHFNCSGSSCSDKMRGKNPTGFTIYLFVSLWSLASWQQGLIIYISFYVYEQCALFSLIIWPSSEAPSVLLSPGLSPLHLAVQHGHKHLARMLLDAGADINAMVSSCAALTHQPLHHCIQCFTFTISVSSKFSPYCALFVTKDGKSGQSPLMHAVESGNTDMVHFLIEVMRMCGHWGKTCDSAQFNIYAFSVSHMTHNYLY